MLDFVQKIEAVLVRNMPGLALKEEYNDGVNGYQAYYKHYVLTVNGADKKELVSILRYARVEAMLHPVHGDQILLPLDSLEAVEPKEVLAALEGYFRLGVEARKEELAKQIQLDEEFAKKLLAEESDRKGPVSDKTLPVNKQQQMFAMQSKFRGHGFLAFMNELQRRAPGRSANQAVKDAAKVAGVPVAAPAAKPSQPEAIASAKSKKSSRKSYFGGK